VSRLSELDDKIVPLLAARLRALVDGVAGGASGVRDRVVGLRSGLVGALRDPRGGVLQRLDDRFAARGPLALLREVPQLGLLLVAAVFLGGAGVALARSGPSGSTPGGPGSAIGAGEVVTVGPQVGDTVASYLEATKARVVDLNRADPDKRYTALVSFVAYAKVEDIATLVEEVATERVFSRAKAAGATSEVLEIEVDQLVPDTLRVFAATAERKALDQEANLSQARSITSTVPTEVAFKAEFVRQAAVEGKEAAAYRTSCECVFAVLVEATARQLSELVSVPGVRTVDVAVAGATAKDVDVEQYFLPEDKGSIPARPRPFAQDYGATSGS
jgi:hypothetical protein